jgi:hypothetical protein
MKQRIKEIEEREEIAGNKEDLQNLRTEIQEADKRIKKEKTAEKSGVNKGQGYLSDKDELLLVNEINRINARIQKHPDRPGPEIKSAALEPIRTIIASTQDPNPIARVIGHVMKWIMQV